MNAKDYYFTQMSDQRQIAQLQQLTHLTWDGDLIDKEMTRGLCQFKLIDRWNGWNIINAHGIEQLKVLGFLIVRNINEPK